MLISLSSHWFCWPLIPKHQAKEWNHVYGEIRSIGLSPTIFLCVKLIRKNISSVELEHLTSKGEYYFCKNAAEEIYPSIEGARTTYVQEKNSQPNVSAAKILCQPSSEAEFLSASPFQREDTKPVAIKVPAPEHHCSYQTAICYFSFPGCNYSHCIVAPE